MGADGGDRRLLFGACLSLTGRFAPFGRQAAHGLRVWAELDGNADVLIEDDASDVRQLQALFPGLAARCDQLLGPYSTVLMRAAGDMAADEGWLVWNHGGSGDDVQSAHPGVVVSVLTPASRYMEPFISHLAVAGKQTRELRIAHGKGRFGLQVAAGAESLARRLGFTHVSMGSTDEILTGKPPDDWILITAGTFEDDTQTVIRARGLAQPPRVTCAVAAGVREFSQAVEHPDGTLGIAQWFSGGGQAALVGPTEHDFLAAYSAAMGDPPDYPAIQAAASAALAAHCARQVGGTNRDLLWPAATALETSTMYGAFKVSPTSGAQLGHQTILTRWIGNKLVSVAGDLPKIAPPASPRAAISSGCRSSLTASVTVPTS